MEVVIRAALLRVAENVMKHERQRSGWSADDACFEVDLRESERELLGFFKAQQQEIARLQRVDQDLRKDRRDLLARLAACEAQLEMAGDLDKDLIP
jgi:hypothetical protein